MVSYGHYTSNIMEGNWIEGIISYSFASKERRTFFRTGTYVLLVGLVFIAAVVSLRQTDQNLTRFGNVEQVRTAGIIADQVDIHIDRALAVVGVRIARPEIRERVAVGDWQGAIETFGPDVNQLSFIDRFFLVDPSGTLRADYPVLGTVGQNFSSREWYRGVIETGELYVTSVYTRAAVPQFNVIAVSAPIRDAENALIGILVAQVHLDTIFSWVRQTELGSSDAVYIVDRAGNLVIHPTQTNLGSITNVSEHPTVQRALNGESGTWTGTGIYGRDNTVMSYVRTNKGFVVVVEGIEPAVYAARHIEMQRGYILVGMFVFIFVALSWFIQRVITLLAFERTKAEAFLRSIGDGVVAIDRSWAITLMNPAASTLIGMDAREAHGKPFREIVRFVSHDGKEEIGFMEDAMLFGESRTMANGMKLIRADGTEMDIGDSASPIKDERGTVTGLIVVFRDVSERKETERSRGEFQSMLAHELRTPITIGKQYTELLMEPESGPLTDKQRDMVRAVRNACTRMNDMVNALLNVSRLEEGAVPVEPEPMFMPDLTDELLEQWQVRAEQRHVALKREYAEGLPSISADSGIMRLVLNNLMSNAIKYTPENGSVTVRVEKSDNELFVRISDTGIGIPADEQKNAFQKFFRASNASEDGVRGTGLGLFTVKKVLEHAGCHIAFESTEGKGTTFSVCIPLKGMRKREGTKGLAG